MREDIILCKMSVDERARCMRLQSWLSLSSRGKRWLDSSRDGVSRGTGSSWYRRGGSGCNSGRWRQAGRKGGSGWELRKDKGELRHSLKVRLHRSDRLGRSGPCNGLGQRRRVVHQFGMVDDERAPGRDADPQCRGPIRIRRHRASSDFLLLNLMGTLGGEGGGGALRVIDRALGVVAHKRGKGYVGIVKFPFRFGHRLAVDLIINEGGRPMMANLYCKERSQQKWYSDYLCVMALPPIER